MSTDNPKNIDDHQLKQLRVALPKMIFTDSQNQPSTSSSQEQEGMNVPTGELAEKAPLEASDKPKGSKRNKGTVSNGDLKMNIRKSKIKPNITEHKEKQPPKSAKSGDGGSTRKRSVSEEKKNKVGADKSTKQTKEKGNSQKDKAKEKKVDGEKKKKSLNKIPEDPHEFKAIKDLLREDPNLPPGWKRIIRGKHVGTELKPVVCIASPEGRKFYFKARLRDYLLKTNSPFSIDEFYFGLYERNEDKAESKNASLNGKKVNAKKSQKQKSSESGVQEHERKKIRLDSGGGTKKSRASKGGAENKDKNSDSSGEGDYEDGGKDLLLEDPDLPEGWTRKVLIKNDAEGCNKIQVCIISPEGKKFRRKHLLEKYLETTKSTLRIDQFYFGVYPKKDGGDTTQEAEQSKESAKKQGKNKRSKKKSEQGEESKTPQVLDDKFESTKKKLPPSPSKSDSSGDEPMLQDPKLPPGWRRHIKVRTTGKSAGRMEVIIASPDGKRHRSRSGLENYIKQKGLDLNPDDFDFTVFGKDSKKYSTGPAASSTPKKKSEGTSKKRSSSAHASEPGSGNVTVEDTQTREAAMINYVSALMMTCGLRDLRSERRVRRQDQEKVLKKYLDSLSPEEVDENDDDNEIPTRWIQTLAHCRSDFGTLEDDAVKAIASLTKDFLITLAKGATKVRDDDTTIEYDDIAEVVDKCKCLASCKTLIPKKKTFKEYMKLNRPTKFTSFT